MRRLNHAFEQKDNVLKNHLDYQLPHPGILTNPLILITNFDIIFNHQVDNVDNVTGARGGLECLTIPLNQKIIFSMITLIINFLIRPCQFS